MGQRTAFLVKRNYKDGSSNVRLVYHQWGIGEIQHRYFMRETFDWLCTRLDHYDHDTTLKEYFLFKNDKDRTIVDFEKDYKNGKNAPDIFNFKVRSSLYGKTDNNNGGMIMEITEDPDSKSFCMIESIKTAFVLGDEEVDDWRDCYKKLISGEDYMRMTSYCKNEKTKEYLEQWISMWNNFVKLYGIEEITN